MPIQKLKIVPKYHRMQVENYSRAYIRRFDHAVLDQEERCPECGNFELLEEDAIWCPCCGWTDLAHELYMNQSSNY